MVKHSWCRFYTTLLTAGMLLSGTEIFAQLQLFSAPAADNRKEKSDEPTVINSDAMDIDMANDKVTLLGNVDVQDPEMNIKCRKMIIFLGKSTGKSASASDAASDDQTGGREVVKIECIGDVVITRNQVETAGKVPERQQAFAGKAVYLIKEETITLTEDPVLVNGVNRLMGERIILYTKTERVLVFKGTAKTKGKGVKKN